ncbi:MAG: hypothetical protein Q7I99_05955, partial [Acholeplasmataceae bacterium]|nr:hypothetical protein [Acholeplasmataceae bacterium]
MKKYVIFIFLLTLIFLVGCTKLGNPNDKTKDPNTTDGCKYIDDDRALVGLSDYENIKRAPFCEVYIDILRDMSVQNDYKGNTIIYHDETELIFMNGNGIFYRYKDKNLEEHDVFYLKINTRVATPSILGYNPTTSTLIAAQKSSDVSGISDISVITGYNMNTQSNYQLASSLGTKAKFLYAGPNGYVIEASDKLTVLDWNFQMVKEYSEALYLGSSLYQNDKENVAILIGESIDNKCLVTVYNGTSSTQSTLYDSCDTVQRLNVQSEYVYFVINHKLYKYDASTDSFTLVPLTTANETVNWVATDSVYKANQIFALVLSKSFITVFNNNMDISQSSSANEVYQVGET